LDIDALGNVLLNPAIVLQRIIPLKAPELSPGAVVRSLCLVFPDSHLAVSLAQKRSQKWRKEIKKAKKKLYAFFISFRHFGLLFSHYVLRH